MSPGDRIVLRFDFGVDGCNGAVGWYVDNIGLICARFDAGGNMIMDTFDANGDGKADVDDSVVTGGGTASTGRAASTRSAVGAAVTISMAAPATMSSTWEWAIPPMRLRTS